jgi:tetratricopeptide (TPR) repeat protein
LARLEAFFTYLRLDLPEEAARHFQAMDEDGAIDRLRRRFGPELGADGGAALVLEKAGPRLRAGGDLRLASNLLRAAAILAPASREGAAGFRRLALLLAEDGDSVRAAESLRLAESLAPDWPRPYLDEALIHYRLDRPDRAGEVLKAAAEALPNSLDFHLGLAKLHLDEAPEKYRDPAGAADAALMAAGISQGKNPAALELLARARERLGLLDAAGEAIGAALELESTEERLLIRERIDSRRREDRKKD